MATAAHPKLLCNALPVPLLVPAADLPQLLHLLLAPGTLVDGWVEEVLPKAADVLSLSGSFKLRRGMQMNSSGRHLAVVR